MRLDWLGGVGLDIISIKNSPVSNKQPRVIPIQIIKINSRSFETICFLVVKFIRVYTK